MAIPANKQELIEAIELNYKNLRRELDDIPAKITRQKNMEGHAKGTLMSVCDLLAYLTGWGQLVLSWNKKKDRGEPVDLPETGYKWNELGWLAQKFYKDYEHKNYDGLLDALDGTVKELLALVNKKTNRQLYEASWHEHWPLGRLVQLNTSSPYQNARLRLRKWKKQKKLN